MAASLSGCLMIVPEGVGHCGHPDPQGKRWGQWLGWRHGWESPRQQCWVGDRRPSAQAEDRTLCFDYFQFPDPQVVI